MLKLLKKSWRRYRFPSRQRRLRRKIGTKQTLWSKTGLHLEFRFFTCLVLCLVFYFIAANIGSGWIYLLSAVLATILFVSIVFPLVLVNSLTVRQELPQASIAGQPLMISISLASPSWMPAYWLRIEYEFAGQTQSHRASTWVIDCLDGESTWSWTVDSPQRGVHPAGKVVVSSSFPLGLAWAKKVFVAPGKQTLTVYPYTQALDGFLLYKLSPSAMGTGGAACGSRSVRQSTYTRGVREYAHGDSPRIVHWASSARTGKLLVREFEAEGFPSYDVLLDLAADWQTSEQFELAVTTVGSLLTLGYKLGIGPELIYYPQDEYSWMDMPAITPGIQYALEILARVQPLEQVVELDGAGDSYGLATRPERSLIVVRPYKAEAASDSCYLVEITADVGKSSPASSLQLDFRINTAGKSIISCLEDLQQL